MHTLNLVNYIRHGMLFNNLAQYSLFDAIIYESYTNQHLSPPEGVTFHTILGDQLSLGQGRELAKTINQYDSVLLVLDTIPVKYLVETLSDLTTDNITIINCNSGITGLPAKGQTELDDIIPLVTLGRHVHEPFDFVSMFAFIQEKGKQYIRLPNKEFIGNLLPDIQDLPIHEGILNATPLGVAGNDTTILCSPSILGDLAQICAQQPDTYDLFALIDYTSPLSEELSDSIEKTANLIVVVDQDEQGAYPDYLHTKLLEAGCTGMDVTFITPHTEHLNQLSPEGLYEQAGFDILGLKEQLE